MLSSRALLLAALLGLFATSLGCGGDGGDESDDGGDMDPDEPAEKEDSNGSDSKGSDEDKSGSGERECEADADDETRGRHMHNIDDEGEDVDDVDACCTACMDNKDCKAYNFEEETNKCFLKKKTPKINGPKGTKGYKSGVIKNAS